jgi:uncharacterized surface protein with fasciclin (FAS1) repeats
MTRRDFPPLAILALALVIAAALLAACGGGDSSASSSPPSDVAAALRHSDQVSQYADAFAAAGVSGDGPFTVFAATNDALTKAGVTLDADAVKASVIDGQSLAKADAAKGAKNDSMLADNSVDTYTGTDGALYVNDFKVVGDPVTTANGTVYVIDGVIQPKK